MVKINEAWEKTKPVNFLREERQLNHPVRKMIRERLRGQSVLDVACLSAIDYPLYEGFDYIGIDFTHKFLDHARELYPGINVVECDAADIQLPDESRDTSYTKDLFEHLPPEKYKQVLSEMFRVSKLRVMIAFYIAPTYKPTEYVLVKNLHYKNHYNKNEIIEEIMKHNPKKIEIFEKIGYNNSALYVVDKC